MTCCARPDRRRSHRAPRLATEPSASGFSWPTPGARWAPRGGSPRRSPASMPTSWRATSHRARGPRSPRPVASGGQPGPRCCGRLGRRRGGPRAAAGRTARPGGTAYLAVGDHFVWFSRVIAQRKALEGDPIVAVLERTLRDADAASAADPADPELRRLRAWLETFLDFVRTFDRAIGLVPASNRPSSSGSSVSWPGAGRDDPPLGPTAGRPAGRRRALARQRDQPALAGRCPSSHEADVRGGPDRRPLDGRRQRQSRPPVRAGPLPGDQLGRPLGIRRCRAIIRATRGDPSGSNGRRPRGRPAGGPLRQT